MMIEEKSKFIQSNSQPWSTSLLTSTANTLFSGLIHHHQNHRINVALLLAFGFLLINSPLLVMTKEVDVFQKDDLMNSNYVTGKNLPSSIFHYSTPMFSSSLLSDVDILDRLNGGQFVTVFDRLMNGQLSRIIEQIKSYYKVDLNPARKLPARQFIKILNYYSLGQMANKLHQMFPSIAYETRMINPKPKRTSLDTMSGYSIGYAKRNLDPMTGLSFGGPFKRGMNFDEIDRSGFTGFAKKRRVDFDEIDRSGFSSLSKRLNDFDEIDRTGFSGFAKRLSDFDEIDRAGFSGFAKRTGVDFDEIDRAGFSNFAKRLNFDELDHAGFSGFSKKRSSGQPTVSNKIEQQSTSSHNTADNNKISH